MKAIWAGRNDIPPVPCLQYAHPKIARRISNEIPHMKRNTRIGRLTPAGALRSIWMSEIISPSSLYKQRSR